MKVKVSKPFLAIDPGYDRVGWAIGKTSASKFVPQAFGCITTSKIQSIESRYQEIHRKLTKIITSYQPTSLAIESVFFSKNSSTAIRVSEAKGVILGTCLQHGLELVEYNPSQIKLATTGHGRASKQAIKKMVLLQLKQIQGDITKKKILDDALDALAIAITHATNQSFK